MPSSRMQPALFGGLVLGVLSALPVVSAGNVCCCLWLIAGGVVAAYVLQSNQATPITTGDGAIAGLLAGIVGSFVYLVLSVPISLLTGPLQNRWVEKVLESGGEVPEAMRPALEAMRQGGLSVLGVVFGFVMMLVLSLLFSTAGGAIGAAIFRKKTPPPPPATEYGAPSPPPPAGM
ncbi:MAG TPA: hypothetical protein PKK95_06440 [Vicinamibacterales bacterium]|nr:hypothetical protein [Acidobacteriota bacterium]HOC17884.1 hypothetical protein [Vicinamibacterales bacterium]